LDVVLLHQFHVFHGKFFADNVAGSSVDREVYAFDKTAARSIKKPAVLDFNFAGIQFSS
jgi:hypothetical protein